MLRSIPSLTVASNSTRGFTRVVFRRGLAADAAAPKKKWAIKRVFWATAALTGSFYVGSTFIAFNNETYYGLFSNYVPLGQSMLDYADSRRWDQITLEGTVESTLGAVVSAKKYVSGMVHGAPKVAEEAGSTKTGNPKDATFRIVRETKPFVKSPVGDTKTKTIETSQNETDTDTAKIDLSVLAERVEASMADERRAMESKLDEQTREYTLKLIELEMMAQDKIDSQEGEYKRMFEEERSKIVHAYREKLDNELRTQSELINDRLKEEVIAQGIELQRRWIREIKVRVEQERGGRLAKLEELSANLKRLERIALDNSTYLDETIRVHALWTAIRAIDSAALSSSVRMPFREELRALRYIATAREDPVASVALKSLEASNVPDIGIEPLADLTTWFTRGVSPKLAEVALVPDQNAGVLSYISSNLLSRLRFKRHGLVAGNDVLSVVARVEHFLNEKDLDSAARELNQLSGPIKVLLHDWLDAARKRLEVQQALEVIQTQAILASLLVV